MASVRRLEGPSLHERALAAGGAATLAGLIANPLDVVRVRAQASSSSATPSACARGRCAFGSLTLMSICDPSCRARFGTLPTMRAVMRSEGPLALWRGAGASVIGTLSLLHRFAPARDNMLTIVASLRNQCSFRPEHWRLPSHLRRHALRFALP